ncbi:MAG: NrfD/PsrC family molybdoenzyme membrane anchor subunit [Dehalococcoidia bacterium]|nr:NrfD/PsrC family molybdoenzyme membrane anchor subunit [Dehalococcoidia bacterium]
MQDRRKLTDSKINEDLLRSVDHTPRAFWIVAGFLTLWIGGGLFALGNMLFWGLGVTGLNRPVMWAFFVTNFVFWVGISHAGVMISSILRLTHAEWRRPVTRAAEVLTVFALSTAALMPIIHAGRPWRVIYWALPYDFNRGVWPSIRSPLIWDPAAIATYLTGAALFIYTTMLPDLAVLRDRAWGKRPLRFWLYAILSLGWRGSSRQWKLQALAGILLSAVILPVFVSVHSIVSWDFAVALVPAWHATIFAPYFVLGAIHSGVSAVVTLMALMRRFFHLEDYITPDHFDALGRLLIAVALGWFYFFFIDFIFGLYSRESAEVAVMELRLFKAPYNILFIIFIFTAFLIPVPLWFMRRVRRSVLLMFITTILVNIGMWLERFIIIVPGLQYKQPLDFTWGEYSVSITELAIVSSTFAVVSLGILLFSKLFPLVPLSDQKEGQRLQDEIEIGKRSVPAVIREE